jgi:hypothetical protein
MVTIAIGWIAYRPLIGITLLVGAGLVLVAFLKLVGSHREAAPPRPVRA